MMRERFRAYTTKHALTFGIQRMHVDLLDPETVEFRYGTLRQIYHKPDWHRTYEEALARAEAMRADKITSLQQTLAKLEAMKFHEMEIV